MTDINWHEILEAYYGVKLWDRMPSIWWHELGDLRASNDEAIDAIKMAANESMKTEERNATVRDLRKWIKIYRGRKRTETASGERRSIIDGIVTTLKQKAESGASRSDIGESIEAEQKRRTWIDTRCGNEILNRVYKK